MGELDLESMAIDLLTIDTNFLYYVKNPMKTKIRDFEFYTFEQVWGNTSGGFECIGGDMMTSQRTYVFIPISFDNDEKCIVFFGGKYAYSVPYSRDFMQDVVKNNVAGMSKRGKYLKKEK